MHNGNSQTYKHDPNNTNRIQMRFIMFCTKSKGSNFIWMNLLIAFFQLLFFQLQFLWTCWDSFMTEQILKVHNNAESELCCWCFSRNFLKIFRTATLKENLSMDVPYSNQEHVWMSAFDETTFGYFNKCSTAFWLLLDPSCKGNSLTRVGWTLQAQIVTWCLK